MLKLQPGEMMELRHWERFLAWLWVAAAIWTTLAFFAPGLTSAITFLLLFTIVGIPLTALLPTVLLYMTGAAPIYLLLRKKSPVIAGGVSVLFVGTVGTILPMVANQQLMKKVEAVVLHDGGHPLEAPTSSIIAYLSGYGPAISDTDCEENCQRLLFSGVARAVIRGNVNALNKEHAPLKRYWLGPAKGRCHPAKMTPARADELDVGSYFPRPLLQQKAQQAYDEGQCLFQGKAALGEADLVLARDDFAGERAHESFKRKSNLRVGRIAQQGWIATYMRSGVNQRPVMKMSYAVAHPLAVPIRLEAPFAFDTYTPGRWATSGTIIKGQSSKHGLSEFLTNDMRVRGLTTEAGQPLPLNGSFTTTGDVG